MNRFLPALAVLLSLAVPAQAAEVVIVNNDGADEGLNDSTPRDPVGGNEGETLGEQRLIALEFAAELLGSRLQSSVPIRVPSRFDSQSCTATNGTLATAGTISLVANFRNAPHPDTFYPVALANALAGRDLETDHADIRATFNSDVDENPLCLTGVEWYYGLDGRRPSGTINFLNVAVHELVHGLGFATFVDLETGAFVDDTPDVYAVFIRDLLIGKDWPEMTDEERRESVENDGEVVWDGPSASSTGAPTLSDGVNQGRIQLYAPASRSPGSSISHWDREVTPDALMEPFVTTTDDVDVTRGIGLATCQLQDIGWTLINGTQCPDEGAEAIQGPAEADGFSSSDGESGGGGGGGTCTLVGSGTPDPLWPTMLLLALAGMAWRIRHG